MSAPTEVGVSINWGVNSVFNSLPWTMETRTHTINRDMEEIKDGQGSVMSVIWVNRVEDVTFKCVVVDGTTGNINAAITLPEPGDKVTVTDSTYAPVAGTTWRVIKPSTEGSFNGALRVTVDCKRWDNIS